MLGLSLFSSRPRAAAAALAAALVSGCTIHTQNILVNFPERPIQSITMNTQAYTVEPRAVDRRSIELEAPEDLHIVAIEHFIGVQAGGYSDNGHLLSLDPENPWTKWSEAGTGMEPTGSKGCFGYCGRDYYSEVSGIADIELYEPFPSGSYVLVPKGAKLYLHTYANNFRDTPQAFHHTVRLLYW
ncbi:MAG: hypothetical protein ACUVYA_03875 [Planctomycetota bacterium]